MGTFFRYLLSFAVQTAWQRSGKNGAIPPMRMPFGKNKGKSFALPILGPWQMMIAMWVARQVWAVYGSQVKDRLRDVNHPVTNRVHDLLPDTKTTTPASTPAVAATPAPVAVSRSTPAPRSAPQYGTQVLDDDNSNHNNNNPHNGSGNLPPGSVLSGLRAQNS